MTARVIDFDAFRAEQKAKQGAVEAPSIKVGGKVYPLPPELPAAIAVDVIRLQKEGGSEADVPPHMLWDIGAALFGGDTFRAVVSDNQLTVNEMGQLIIQVFTLYDPTAGKGTIPNRKTRSRRSRSTSSRTGRS